MYSTILATSSTSKILVVRGGRSTECASTSSLNKPNDAFTVHSGPFEEQSRSRVCWECAPERVK